MKELNSFNWPVVGHKNISTFLQKSIVNNSLTHAYLFLGAEGIGKFHVARAFGKTLLCESETEARPCGKCSNCQQIDKGIHPDFYVLEREVSETTGKTKNNITVNQVRDLQEKIGKRAFLNSYKIVIIKEAEALNPEASNALLKTLEEPTAKTIIIIIATSKENVLPTIVSRCQKFNFLPLTNLEIEEHLLKNGANQEEARKLAAFAGGRPEVAIHLFSEKENSAKIKEFNLEICDLVNKGLKERFKFAEDMADDEDQLAEKLEKFIILLRDAILLKENNDLVVNVDEIDKVKAVSEKYSITKLKSLIEELEKTKKYLKQNINAKVALENLLLNF